MPPIVLFGVSEKPKIDPALVQKMLEQYMGNPGSRTTLANAMAQPLRARRDYQSVARKAFLVDQMGPKHRCRECSMGWDDDAYVHDDNDCAIYRVIES